MRRFVLRELVVAKTLVEFEVEPEWCSEALLSSISVGINPNAPQEGDATAVTLESPAPVSEDVPTATESAEVADAIQKSETEAPVAASLAAEAAAPPVAPCPPAQTPEPEANLAPDLGAVPVSVPVSSKPIRVKSKSRPDTKIFKKPASPSRAATLLASLRTRKMRLVASVACVLIVVGLIAMNGSSSKPNLSDDTTDMDLAEFDSAPGLDGTRLRSAREPQPFGSLADAEPITEGNRFGRSERGPRMSSFGEVTHANHDVFGGTTAGDVIPASATARAGQGAVLTGQIELDSATSPSDTLPRTFRDFRTR